jgi:hypothetical protein
MGFAGIEVIQSQPGEVSLFIDRLKGDPHFAAEVKSRFSAINGIQQVEPDAARGEVLVLYDKKTLTSLNSLLALKATFSHLFPEVDTFRLATWLSQYL